MNVYLGCPCCLLTTTGRVLEIRICMSGFFFSNFTSNYGNCKRKKVSKPHFLGKIWFIYNISKVVYNGFQRRFLNCLESFVIRFLWKCLFLTSILQKVPIWENFSPGIMNKNISTSNTADFSSLLSWLFSMIFWLMM